MNPFGPQQFYNYPMSMMYPPVSPSEDPFKVMRKWKKFLKEQAKEDDDKKKSEDEKKKKHDDKKGMSPVQLAIILGLASPLIGVGYILTLSWAMRVIATALKAYTP